jgi:uncharacterized protein (DUF302 family)
VNALEVTVGSPLAEAEAAVRRALEEAGFGVLTEIDVAATLRARLGVERPGLKILGACRPELAHRALEADPSLALVLPCNVVLEAVPGGTRVAVVDPRELIDAPGLSELVEEARTRLEGALASLGGR